MESWHLNYSQEAKNYFVDNGALVEDLFFAIEALAQTDGIPDGGATQLEQGTLLFEPAGHIVIYERLEVSFTLRVTVIKPKP